MLVRAFESIFIIYIAITRTCNVSKMTLSDPSWWILNLKINAKSNSGKILELLTVPKFFKKGSVDISWKLPVRILYKNILIEEKLLNLLTKCTFHAYILVYFKRKPTDSIVVDQIIQWKNDSTFVFYFVLEKQFLGKIWCFPQRIKTNPIFCKVLWNCAWNIIICCFDFK